MYSRVILRHLLRELRMVFTTARLQTEVSSGVGTLKLHGTKLKYLQYREALEC